MPKIAVPNDKEREIILSKYPVYDVPVELIQVQGERGRQRFVNIDELADSIERLGQLQPIVLRVVLAEEESDGTVFANNYELVAGERRLRAHQKLGLKTIRAVLMRDLSELDSKIIELAENKDRESMTWQEEIMLVAQIHTLAAEKEDQEPTQILTARYTGYSAGYVSEALKLATALQAGNVEIAGYQSREQAVKKLRMDRERQLTIEVGRRALEAAMAAANPASLVNPSPSPSPSPNPLDSQFLSKMESLQKLADIDDDDEEGIVKLLSEVVQNGTAAAAAAAAGESLAPPVIIPTVPPTVSTIIPNGHDSTPSLVSDVESILLSEGTSPEDEKSREIVEKVLVGDASESSVPIPGGFTPNIWKGGLFEIINEDCNSAIRKFESGRFSAVITDPIWGINIEENITLRKGFDTHFVDSPVLLENMIPGLAEEFFRVLKRDAFVFIFTSTDFLEQWREGLDGAGFEVRPQPLIWVKENGSYTHTATRFMSAYEMILFARKGSRLLPSAVTDVFQFNRPDQKDRIVATQKPVALMERLIQIATVPGEWVLDPFCGSGTTLVAGVRGRRFVTGVDIHEGMCRISAFRVQKELQAAAAVAAAAATTGAKEKEVNI